MNVLFKALLALGLILVLISVAQADSASAKEPQLQAESQDSIIALPGGEVTPPAQPAQGAVTSLPPSGKELQTLGAGGPASADVPAAELIKVSRLEPAVSPAAALTAEERQLEQRKADFLKFAQGKVVEMNRNHILSRERMQIQKRPEGGYKASYHQLDDSSMSCQVSRSPTKTAQYVAVLSYKERVYTAACGTPVECRQASFSPSEVIPNRHIFVYTNGTWQ